MNNVRLLILTALWLTVLLTGIWVLRTTQVTHDLAQFMPKGATDTQRIAATILREGPASRVILIALQGASEAELAATSQRLTSQLRANRLFTRISNGDISHLAADDFDLLFRYRYLLSASTNSSSFSSEAITLSLQQRLDELAAALPLVDRTLLETDPTSAFQELLKTWQSGQPRIQQHGVWFSADRERALIIAVTRGSGYDPLEQQKAIAAIQNAYAKSAPTDGTHLLMSGAPVFANDTRNAIRKDIILLSTIGSCIVVAILLLSYRSLLFPLLAGLPLITGFIIGSMVTALAFGNIHGITLVFGITLLGVGIDYPIHLFSHLSTRTTPVHAMQRIWPTLRLGVITTCTSYLAFAQRDFVGLAQLGIFTATGLLASAAMTRWLLPHLLTGYNPLGRSAALGGWLHIPLQPSRSFSLTVLALSTGALVFIFTFSPPRWETNLSALSPLSLAQRQLDARLRADLDAPDVSQMILIKGKDLELVLQSSEHIARTLQQAIAEGLLSDIDLASRYLPSAATQKSRQASLPDPAEARLNLAESMKLLPFKRDTFDPFLRSLSESRSLPPLRLEDIQDTPLAMRVSPLLFKQDENWNSLVLLTGIRSNEAFRSWWQKHAPPTAEYLDLTALTEDMLDGFRDSALERLLLGVLLIVIILSLGLRSLISALQTLLPALAAAGLTIGIITILGERLSLFHLIAVLLTIGIGLDYSLFFQRFAGTDIERQATLFALAICAVSTISIFGILATSELPVLRAIGLTVAVGVQLCFLFAFSSTYWIKPKGPPPLNS